MAYALFQRVLLYVRVYAPGEFQVTETMSFYLPFKLVVKWAGILP